MTTSRVVEKSINKNKITTDRMVKSVSENEMVIGKIVNKSVDKI
jgi:hypothetical protein